MDPDGNRLQTSCSPRHWGHSTMHRVPTVSGTTTITYTLYMYRYMYIKLYTVAIIFLVRWIPWEFLCGSIA